MISVILAVLIASMTWGPQIENAPVSLPVTTFHNCSSIGGTGNSPHLFDTSEIYHCDEGNVEIAGHTTMVIEYGYVFTQELGRPIGEPHRATASDYRDYKWCPKPASQDPNQMEMCGDKPHMCFDKKLTTWDPEWQGYSCATPDHQAREESK